MSGTNAINITSLPEYVLYPGSQNHKSSVFPIGVTGNGEVTYDVIESPHVLIAGSTGSGKSAIQRNILLHCLQHSDDWRVFGVDLKRVELTPYDKYKKTVMGIATDLEQALEVLRYVNEEIMSASRNSTYSTLIMIDEVSSLLGASGLRTEKSKAEDFMRSEAIDLISNILRLGRSTGVHMVMSTQRPDATIIPEQLKSIIDVRIAMGQMDAISSNLILGNDKAAHLSNIRGRGLINIHQGKTEEFQAYFVPQDSVDSFILKE